MARKIKRRPATSSKPKRRTTSAKKTKPRTGTGFDRGAKGFDRAEEKRAAQEERYQKQKNTPWGFWLKVGTQAEIVILDEGEPFFTTIHKVKGAQGKWEDEVCIADTGDNCPLCESTGKEGSYVMVLTILDRRPYKTRDGKTVKVSKRLLIVKGRNLAKFQRQYKKHKGNLRGLRVICRRDGDKEASIGEDLEFLGKLKASALKKFKELAVVADYEEIYEMPTASELRKRHSLGKSNSVGDEEFTNDEDYDLDEVGWD